MFWIFRKILIDFLLKVIVYVENCFWMAAEQTNCAAPKEPSLKPMHCGRNSECPVCLCVFLLQARPFFEPTTLN